MPADSQSEKDARGAEAGVRPEAAADDPQPPEVVLPRSWPADKAELWTSLPPEAQAVIAAREGQRDAAVNCSRTRSGPARARRLALLSGLVY